MRSGVRKLMSKHSFFQELKDILPYLKPAQTRLANYIMKRPRKVINMSIKDLAGKTDTAASTVVDFCKKLGFPGFKSLKISLAQELELVESMSLDLEKISRISKNLFSFTVDNLKPVLSSVSADDIQKCCESLLKSDVVEIMAFGFDGVAGYDLFLKLKHIGFQVNFFDNPYLQNISASYADSKTCVIAISSSHSSRDLLDSISYARNAGANIIGIAPPDSNIAKESDILLPTYARTRVLPEGGILTRYIQLFIIDMLFLKLLEMGKDRFQKAYKDFEGILNYRRRR